MDKIKFLRYNISFEVDMYDTLTFTCKWPEEESIVKDILLRLVYKGMIPNKYRKNGIPWVIEKEDENTWITYNTSGFPIYRLEKVTDSDSDSTNVEVSSNGRYDYLVSFVSEGVFDNMVISKSKMIEDIYDVRNVEKDICDMNKLSSVKVISVSLLGGTNA